MFPLVVEVNARIARRAGVLKLWLTAICLAFVAFVVQMS
jgi:hypothetical protein